MKQSPSYLVIGHITRDLYPGGYKLGGTATFSALTAHNLGHPSYIITSCARNDLDLGRLPSEITVRASPALESTSFENVYQEGVRQQYLRGHASIITCQDIPAAWQRQDIVHLGPVDQEVDPDLASAFPDSLLAATPQGWMRKWDSQGIVYPVEWVPSKALLRRIDVLVLSEEDVGRKLDVIESLAEQAKLVVLTSGWKGSTVYYKGQRKHFPSPQVVDRDPTGAGDIYAASFLSLFYQTADPWKAAQFANCVAAHSVERSGLSSIPTRSEIERCQPLCI